MAFTSPVIRSLGVRGDYQRMRKIVARIRRERLLEKLRRRAGAMTLAKAMKAVKN